MAKVRELDAYEAKDLRRDDCPRVGNQAGQAKAGLHEPKNQTDGKRTRAGRHRPVLDGLSRQRIERRKETLVSNGTALVPDGTARQRLIKARTHLVPNGTTLESDDTGDAAERLFSLFDVFIISLDDK